jgi:hypothetical protein
MHLDWSATFTEGHRLRLFKMIELKGLEALENGKCHSEQLHDVYCSRTFVVFVC